MEELKEIKSLIENLKSKKLFICSSSKRSGFDELENEERAFGYFFEKNNLQSIAEVFMESEKNNWDTDKIKKSKKFWGVTTKNIINVLTKLRIYVERKEKGFKKIECFSRIEDSIKYIENIEKKQVKKEIKKEIASVAKKKSSSNSIN
jgi:hypothetical protein